MGRDQLISADVVHVVAAQEPFERPVAGRPAVATHHLARYGPRSFLRWQIG